MPECLHEKANRARCTCTYEPCPRKGTCCECLEYHRRKDQLPACYFTASQERTYDRSVTYFVSCRTGRG
jgi:hypothetical protein